MNILLIRTGGLGDCLLTLPAVSRIKAVYPGADLHILGNGTMLEVARLSGIFSGFTSIDTSGFHCIYIDTRPDYFLTSYFSQYDIVFAFSAGDHTLLSRNILAAGAGKSYMLDPRPPESLKGHISEYLISIVPETGTAAKIDAYPSSISQFSRTPNTLAIHPGSGSRSKNWPLENFLHIAAQNGMKTTLILGAAEIERGMGDEIPDGITVNQPETIDELYWILAGTALYIGNDSGVSHLAAFAGTTSIVLFGPTNPAVWQPLGDHVTVLSSPDNDISSISCEDVLAAFDEISAKRLSKKYL